MLAKWAHPDPLFTQSRGEGSTTTAWTSVHVAVGRQLLIQNQQKTYLKADQTKSMKFYETDLGVDDRKIEKHGFHHEGLFKSSTTKRGCTPGRPSLNKWRFTMTPKLFHLLFSLLLHIGHMDFVRPTRFRHRGHLKPRPALINYRQEEKRILDRILDSEVYDRRMRPSGMNSTDDPTIVNVNLYVRSFEKIDDVKMEYSVQITFRQQWNDNRLSFDDMEGRIKYLTMTDSKKVWMPDTFFRNEKEGKFHNIIQPNLYIRVFPNGDILYSIRISLTLSCPMSLELFPLDTQTCFLRVASYGWTVDDVVYNWKVPEPVQFVKTLFLPGGFGLHTFSDAYCNVKTATGEYSCLTVIMTFRRQLSYYIITIYIPTLMIVMVSWMSFWLDHKSAPARVSLTVTTLLAMSTTTSSINNSLPPVAYTKAIDVWTNLCVTFVFLALLEYALVNYAARADARANANRASMERQMEKDRERINDPANNFLIKEMDMRQNQVQLMSRDPLIRRIEGSNMVRENNKLLFSELPRDRFGRFRIDQNGPDFTQGNPMTVKSVLTSINTRVQSEAKRIDVISRVIFPLSFVGFNVMYWSYYLTRSHFSS
ncbi:GRGLCN [Lepeophtheirus salmonis]|uniref:GRGLCN n=1 Tax=Lepeophtheirus salmonis TaxID=72036 RepID=A0A7R8CIH8_LEPSM|nr:GRGLCN [Lepeophtheirus salmonis]CAF2829253.1 GRGLCN [Lepeophtheirus salmonis]